LPGSTRAIPPVRLLKVTPHKDGAGLRSISAFEEHGKKDRKGRRDKRNRRKKSKRRRRRNSRSRSRRNDRS